MAKKRIIIFNKGKEVMLPFEITKKKTAKKIIKKSAYYSQKNKEFAPQVLADFTYETGE